MALARVTIRTRERLATLRPYEDALMLETMFWPDEIRSTGALDLPEGAEKTVRPKELKMAESLVASLADRFDPTAYTDTYRVALEELIARRQKGDTRNAKRRKASPKVIDLMEALQASVDASKGRTTPSRRGRKAAAGKATAKRRRRRSAA